jgi:hypothetical protein
MAYLPLSAPSRIPYAPPRFWNRCRLCFRYLGTEKGWCVMLVCETNVVEGWKGEGGWEARGWLINEGGCTH